MGDIAVVTTYAQVIKLAVPNAHLTIYAAGDLPKGLGGVIRHPWYRRRRQKVLMLIESIVRVLWSLLSQILSHLRHSTKRYDLVIDSVADRFNERYDCGDSVYLLGMTLLARIFFRDSIILVGPTSIGRFRSGLTRRFARFVLDKVDVVIARDQESKQNLSKLSIRSQIFLIPDIAFLTEPRLTCDTVREWCQSYEGFLVGITPNRTMDDRHPNHYCRLMAEIIDWLVEKMGARICMIPQHEPAWGKTDYDVAQKILSQTRNKGEVKIVSEILPPGEMKGLLGTFDVFIGCRLHCCIFSISMGVPTLAISYGEKMTHVLGELLGDRHYICPIEGLSLDIALSRLEQLRSVGSENLKRKTIHMQAEAYTLVHLVRNLARRRTPTSTD